MGESEKPVHGSNACPSLENVALHDPTPSTPACQLAAGEKQKVEILKELYLASHFLILDELAIGDWRLANGECRFTDPMRESSLIGDTHEPCLASLPSPGGAFRP